MKKNAKKTAAKALNATLRAAIATAAGIGFDIATGYAAAVELARKVAKSRAALNEAGAQYKAGYVARYLSDIPAVAKRWGNMDQAARIAAAADVIAKATPESSKPNRRTETEHKACRAADVSWSTAKRRAGILAEKKGGRAPRPAAKASTTVKALPVDLVKASPRLGTPTAANDYFATAAAALLATVNKNAKHVPPAVSTAVTDFHAALRTAGLIK
jgi:hypothetical protein